MKYVLMLVGGCSFFFMPRILRAQHDTLVVNGNVFLRQVKIVSNEFGTKDTLMNLFCVKGGKKELTLSYFTYQYSADCNNEFWDKGELEVKGDSLIVRMRHLQKGHDPIPIKSEKIYLLKENGKLQLISDKRLLNGKWIHNTSN